MYLVSSAMYSKRSLFFTTILNGNCPVTIKYTVTPSEYISILWSYFYNFKISGAIKPGVPLMFLTLFPPGWVNSANPKSVITRSTVFLSLLLRIF